MQCDNCHRYNVGSSGLNSMEVLDRTGNNPFKVQIKIQHKNGSLPRFCQDCFIMLTGAAIIPMLIARGVQVTGQDALGTEFNPVREAMYQEAKERQKKLDQRHFEKTEEETSQIVQKNE